MTVARTISKMTASSGRAGKRPARQGRARHSLSSSGAAIMFVTVLVIAVGTADFGALGQARQEGQERRSVRRDRGVAQTFSLTSHSARSLCRKRGMVELASTVVCREQLSGPKAAFLSRHAGATFATGTQSGASPERRTRSVYYQLPKSGDNFPQKTGEGPVSATRKPLKPDCDVRSLTWKLSGIFVQMWIRATMRQCS